VGSLIRELLYDLRFVRGHRLQPGWYKVAKAVVLVAAVVGYLVLFGPVKTAVLAAVFLLLSLVVHLVYRAGTDRFTRSWLDFRVREENGRMVPVSIGRVYYSVVAANAAIAVASSQLIVPT
jgi:hypothetical protein